MIDYLFFFSFSLSLRLLTSGAVLSGAGALLSGEFFFWFLGVGKSEEWESSGYLLMGESMWVCLYVCMYVGG